MPYQLGDTPRLDCFDWANHPRDGRGSWTRTNECQDQNLMPYQLGDTPISRAMIIAKIFKITSIFY